MAHSTDDMENKGVNKIPNYRKWVADNIKVKAHVGGGIMEECIDQMLVRLKKLEDAYTTLRTLFLDGESLALKMEYRLTMIEKVLENLLKEQSCPSTHGLSDGLPDPTLRPSARSKKASKS